MEAVLKRLYPGDQKTAMANMSKEYMEELMIMLTQKGERKYHLDGKSKDLVQGLLKKRVTGIYKDNVEGFVDEFMELSEKLTYDESRPITPTEFLHSKIDDTTKNAIYDELYEDRFLMAEELTEQLSLKIKEHLYLKKRKASDFVKPRQSELDIFRSQVVSHQNTIEHMEEEYNKVFGKEPEKKEGFDRETFHRLKAEIKLRREAKERLLEQGLPEFKPYATI